MREQPAPAVAAGANEEAGVTQRTGSKATKATKAPQTASPRRPGKAAKGAGDTSVEGIRISHPDRVVDASTGLTKLDVVNHYLHVAGRILPHLAGRPVSLVRAPSGIAGPIVFQRHAGTLRIAGLKQLDPALSPDHEPMVEVDSFTTLISAAQANAIEFHTWNATSRDAAHPDRIVFDLDPGEGLAWAQMQEAAALTHSLLEQLGLASFLKTSGGKGLHVVVPIAPRHDWDTVKAFAKAVVEHMAAVIPERFVARSGPKNRVGKVFVDYLRNGFGATTACAWSARARPGLGVSVPCAWDELGAVAGGAHWTIANLHERLEEKVDPWRDYGRKRPTLAAAMKKLGLPARPAGLHT